MARAYNFCAGPAALPEAVLTEAREQLLDWQGRGTSVMEISHRSQAFMQEVATAAEQDLRDLLAIPDNYRVIFSQGGAAAQFSLVPLNLGRRGRQADYLNTGIWSKKALTEAGRYLAVNVAADGAESRYTAIPDPATWRLDPGAAYCHYTPNETIGGVEFGYIPACEEVPLVADMSSTLLSRPLDISRFGVIYAGAQKNIGPAGITLLIVREDLLEGALPATPATLTWKIQAENDSMYNTPPTFSWYLSGLVFRWLKGQGGVAAMARINRRKAEKLYAAIDQSDFYSNPVAPEARSWMNVPFILADESLNGEFLRQSEAAGLLNLKGHRSVGGMRASIYNAVPEAAVDALIRFMSEFAQRHG
jgi:phosphoserine aminotransferase